MSYEITLNWNIITYEVTATGGREAPTIITSSMKKGTWPGNVAAYGQKIYKHLDLLETFRFYYKHFGFINNYYKSLPSSHFL